MVYRIKILKNIGLALTLFVTCIIWININCISNRTVEIGVETKSFGEYAAKQTDFIQDYSAQQDIFMQDNSKKVLLYSYMRGGSTLLGDLFRMNPDAIYWFEHMCGFYQAAFGLKPGSTPLNVLYFSNQTKRTVGAEEVAAVADFHHQIFSCSYEHVPLELLIDQHNLRRSTFNVENVTNGDMGYLILDKCRKHLTGLCGLPGIPATNRGGKNQDKKRRRKNEDKSKYNIEHSLHCFHDLAKVRKGIELNTANNTNYEAGLKLYTGCMEGVKDIVIPRYQSVINKCRRTKLHVLKAIRLTMEYIDKIMERIQDMYFIHYMRDPRGIISSRWELKLLTFDLETESKLLCERMLLDLEVYQQLKQKYPHRVMAFTYEDLALHPHKTAAEVYAFINTSVPPEVYTWLTSATNAKEDSFNRFDPVRANASASVYRWQRKLTPMDKQVVFNSCKQLLTQMNYT